jgi:hypothetical protein
MIVHDGAFLIDAALHVLCRCGNTLQKIFQQKHVQSLRQNSTRDAWSWIGGEIGMNDKSTKQTFGSF